MSNKIYIGSDSLVTLDKLEDNLNDGYVNDATCSGVLTLTTDSTVIDSFTLDYEASSDGKYEGTIPASVTETLTEEGVYKIRATATKDGATYYAELIAEARTKRFT